MAGSFVVLQMSAELGSARKNRMAEGSQGTKIAQQRVADLCSFGREIRLIDRAMQNGSGGNEIFGCSWQDREGEENGKDQNQALPRRGASYSFSLRLGAHPILGTRDGRDCSTERGKCS